MSYFLDTHASLAIVNYIMNEISFSALESSSS